MVMTGAAVIAAGAAWHVKSVAQENAASGVGVVTVFDHAKLDASFAKALAKGGTAPIWSRTSSYGTSEVSVHSRESTNSACPAQGCSHKGYTAVVIVVSRGTKRRWRSEERPRLRGPTNSEASWCKAVSRIVSAKAMCSSCLRTRFTGTRTWRHPSVISRCRSHNPVPQQSGLSIVRIRISGSQNRSSVGVSRAGIDCSFASWPCAGRRPGNSAHACAHL